VIKMSSPIPKKKMVSKMMNFGEALEEVVKGKHVTKMEWKRPSEYILLKDGFLSIYRTGEKSGEFHRLMVSHGDLIGTDWQIIEEVEYDKN